MENTRSILSRISGLALFILALLIVGLLVIFTVDTADDEGTVVTDDNAIIDQEPGTAAGDLDSEPGATEDETGDGGTVAPASQDGLPDTGVEDAILPAAVLGLLAWQTTQYRKSRQQFKSAVGLR